MLKGKAKITLTDVNTGEQEVYEQTNLVTNAVKYLYEIMEYGNKVPNDVVLPLSTKALGGMFLFDGTLTSNINNIEMPSDAKLIGYCDQSISTRINSGSLTVESGEIVGGYKNVWEFTTSQCNGNISSLALTINGHDAIKGSYQTEISQKPTYGRYICYNNGYFYSIVENGSNKFSVYKERQNVSEIKVNDSVGSSGGYELFKSIDIPSGLIGNNIWGISIAKDGYVYLASCTANSSGDGVISYISIKVSDLSFNISTVQTITCGGCLFKSQYVTYVNNKFYCLSNDGKSAYIVDTSLNNAITSISFGGNYQIQEKSSPRYFTENGNGLVTGLVYNGGSTVVESYKPIYIYSDNTFKIIEGYKITGSGWLNVYYPTPTLYGLINGGAYGASFNGVPYHTGYSGSNSMCLLIGYLGTICNLETPIVKDSTKTMKIEYSLIDS